MGSEVPGKRLERPGGDENCDEEVLQVRERRTNYGTPGLQEGNEIGEKTVLS